MNYIMLLDTALKVYHYRLIIKFFTNNTFHLVLIILFKELNKRFYIILSCVFTLDGKHSGGLISTSSNDKFQFDVCDTCFYVSILKL